MSQSSTKNDDRRVTSRKTYALPVRYTVLTEELVSVPYDNLRGEIPQRSHPLPVSLRNRRNGETVNLSERGMYFTSHEKVSIGEPLEIFFTLPTELTGRSPEQVCCRARVVHVDRLDGRGELIGVGAAIERFERITKERTWDN
jgi:PilZ domain